jgi:acetyltransferase-like isoleucine patch superfamily enzyme
MFNMKTILRNLLNKFSYFKLKKKMNISVGENSSVNFRSFDLKNNINCRLNIGKKSLVASSLVFEKDGAIIEIGNNTFMGGSVLSCANKIKIGDNVHIAWNVSIFDHNSHPINHYLRRNDLPDLFLKKKNWDNVDIRPTIICDDAWIGVNVIILKGIEIGAGAIVAAGAVVTKNVPPMTLVAGNPAQVIKELKY